MTKPIKKPQIFHKITMHLNCSDSNPSEDELTT